jgi:branched-chain amino acid transport system substrate-binding protein
MSKSHSRRRILKAAMAGTGLAFFGPFRHLSYAQGKKPIKLGLTCDASGQYGDSGQDDMRGMIMAIDEFNAKGGVLGPRSPPSRRTPRPRPPRDRASRSASSRATSAAFCIGALSSGVANAISQVAQSTAAST